MTKKIPAENSPENTGNLKNIRIEDYTYDLPEGRIAKFPLEKRDASKLLIYNDGEISERHFFDVPEILNSDNMLVFNNTKVIYARVLFQKTTGAVIEVFCLEPYVPADYVQSFASYGRCEWKCMVGNLKKWKEGTIYCRYQIDGVEYQLAATQKIRYQTVYSKNEGSVAAPTAGLHFSLPVLDALREKGVRIEELTLHVGAGTFRPVKSETIGGHDMHTEHISVRRDVIRKT